MEQLLKLILSEKGRDGNRVGILAVCLFIAWKVTDLDKRVSNLETRPVAIIQHTNQIAKYP